MKNIIKKSLKIWAIAVSVVCGVPMVLAVVWMQVEKKTGYKRLKALVQKVYTSEEVQACIKELKLKEIPVLKFEKLNGSVMESRFTYYKSLLTVTKTIPEYTIYIDLDKLINQISVTCVMAYTFKHDTITSVIKFLLLHECRHVYQAQEKFWVGYTATDFLHFGGYGEQRHEKDANEFAVSCAEMSEKALMEFLKYQQETAGKVFTNDHERLQVSRNLWKEQNPLMYIWHMLMSEK